MLMGPGWPASKALKKSRGFKSKSGLLVSRVTGSAAELRLQWGAVRSPSSSLCDGTLVRSLWEMA